MQDLDTDIRRSPLCGVLDPLSDRTGSDHDVSSYYQIVPPLQLILVKSFRRTAVQTRRRTSGTLCSYPIIDAWRVTFAP
jgi:hypothetical protein